MQRGYKTARRLHDSQSCAELMKHNKRIHNMTPSQFVSVWINAPQFTERSCSFQHRRYKHTEQPPLQASSPSPLLSLTTYENHRFVEIKKNNNFDWLQKKGTTPFTFLVYKIQPWHVVFPVEVNYEERRAVIGLLTINRHDVLFWLPPKRAVKKGERPTARVTDGGGFMRWYSP